MASQKKKKSCVTRASDATLLSGKAAKNRKKTEEEKPSWKAMKERKSGTTQKQAFRHPSEW